MLNEYGEITRSKNDYDVPQGLTSKPLSEDNQHFMTITHQYINLTNWTLKIMYHMKANILHWPETNKGNIKSKIVKAKESILQDLRTKTGLRLDQINGSNEKTGNSTTGQQGREFFSEKHRLSILEYVPTQHQDNLKKLMHQLSVILRVVSSTN